MYVPSYEFQRAIKSRVVFQFRLLRIPETALMTVHIRNNEDGVVTEECEGGRCADSMEI
jgi:hypothetical protein